MNIPTAQELFDKMVNENDEVTSTDMMIEFAKLHVEQALEAVSNITHKNGISRIIDNKESILNSYPLTNIK